jgi:hypothetical protein
MKKKLIDHNDVNYAILSNYRLNLNHFLPPIYWKMASILFLKTILEPRFLS